MIIRTDVLDTTPGARGETCLFAPPKRVTSPEMYRRWLDWMEANGPITRQYVIYIARIYAGANGFVRPSMNGPFSEALGNYFEEKAKILFGKMQMSKAAVAQKDGPPSDLRLFY